MLKEQMVRLLGSKRLTGVPKTPVKENDISYVEDGGIPKAFDARLEWKYCKTIGQVRDQGNCGSCWVKDKNHCA